MNKIILILLVSFLVGQESEVNRIAKDDSKTGILAREFQMLSNKIAFLEEQLGIVEPSNFELAYVELDSIIAQAPDWFYKTPREQCIKYVESIIQALKDNDKAQAISIIDFLILNQEKYFYKKYNRRPITVARFEALKQLIGE